MSKKSGDDIRTILLIICLHDQRGPSSFVASLNVCASFHKELHGIRIGDNVENGDALIVHSIDVCPIFKQEIEHFLIRIHVEEVYRLETILVPGNGKPGIGREHCPDRFHFAHMNGVVENSHFVAVRRNG